MPFYRKKPVTIKALQYTGKNSVQIADFMNAEIIDEREGGILIKTLEGPLTAKPGDYIIRGMRGEFYPCKPDIFSETYEVVTDCFRYIRYRHYPDPVDDLFEEEESITWKERITKGMEKVGAKLVVKRKDFIHVKEGAFREEEIWMVIGPSGELLFRKVTVTAKEVRTFSWSRVPNVKDNGFTWWAHAVFRT